MQIRPPLDTGHFRRPRRGGPGAGGRLQSASPGRRPRAVGGRRRRSCCTGCGRQSGPGAGNQLELKAKDVVIKDEVEFGYSSNIREFYCLR